MGPSPLELVTLSEEQETEEHKAAIQGAGKDESRETSPASTLILDFHPPENCEKINILFKTPSQWSLAMAV